MAYDPIAEHDPLIGRVLSERYRVRALLGEGGIGRVYVADHLETGREVALKVLLPELAGNIQLVDTFLEEARTVSRLGHENIIDIYYGGRAPDGLAFLVMERLRGLDLADTLRPEPMPWERARPIFIQVCRALGAVHAHGIIHGDIKPANIFLVDDGARRDFVKVLDFGIAKAMRVGRQPEESQLAILGTPQYMAPEQALGRETDGRADVYALGCVMYRVLTGSVPFNAESAVALMAKHGYEVPVPPRQRRPELGIASSVEQVILRAMEKSPARRFASMEEMADAISRCRLTSLAPMEASPSAQFKIDDPSVVVRARRKRRRTIVTTAAGVVAALALAAAIVHEVRPGRLEITTNPPNAIIQVDGRLGTDRTPEAITVARGRHVVAAWRRGYITEKREIRVKPGERLALRFDLQVSPDTGLEITSEPPGAEIWLDGRRLEQAPGVPARTAHRAGRVRPGRHSIELRGPRGVWQSEVEVQPDRLTPVHGVLPLPKPFRPPGRKGRSLAELR